MGTTLTGTTPQDTYDSLIKVTDNGPLSGTAKYLSDGLGNDSVLALSTAQVGIGTSTTSARLGVDNALNVGVQSLSSDPSAASVFLSNTGTSVGLAIATTNANVSYLQGRQKTGTGNAFDIALNPLGGNVGIGTSSPDGKLDVASAGNLVSTGAFTNPHIALTLSAPPVDNDTFAGITFPTSDSANYGWSFGAERTAVGQGNLGIRFHNNSATGTQIARFTSNGLCFGSDTAAANALDDYEEGTWTPTITGAGGNPTVTYAAGNTGGIYTKIGNQVTVSFEVRWTALSGGSGAVTIAGLPYSRRVTTLPDGDRLIVDSYDNTISGKYLTGNVGTNNSSIALSMVNSAAAPTDLVVSDLSTSGLGFLRGTVTYFV